jgi:hypothetical protein
MDGFSKREENSDALRASATAETKSSASGVEYRIHHREFLSLLAAHLERVALSSESSDKFAPEESRGDGLEFPQHAALSVSARFPDSESRRQNGFTRGEYAWA